MRDFDNTLPFDIKGPYRRERPATWAISLVFKTLLFAGVVFAVALLFYVLGAAA